jgi:hypothetical protein
MLWSRIVRWLATGSEALAGEELSLALDRLRVAPDELVTATVTARGALTEGRMPTAELIGPDGGRRALPLVQVSPQSARFIAGMAEARIGAYRVEVRLPGRAVPAQGGFTVADASVEGLDTSADPRTLESLARATGGACVPVDQPGRLVEMVHQLRRAAIPDRALDYAFDQPWLFAVVVLVLGAEWWLRRRWGLL